MGQTEEERRNVEAFRIIVERIINDGEFALCDIYMDPAMVISRFGLAATAALLAPDRPKLGGGGAIEGFKAGLAMLRTAFPDWSHRIEKIVAKDDWVSGVWTLNCTHQGNFMGLAPTGAAISMAETGVMRFVDGRMVEGWFLGDELGLVRQLGVELAPGNGGR